MEPGDSGCYCITDANEEISGDAHRVHHARHGFRRVTGSLRGSDCPAAGAKAGTAGGSAARSDDAPSAGGSAAHSADCPSAGGSGGHLVYCGGWARDLKSGGEKKDHEVWPLGGDDSPHVGGQRHDARHRDATDALRGDALQGGGAEHKRGVHAAGNASGRSTTERGPNPAPGKPP